MHWEERKNTLRFQDDQDQRNFTRHFIVVHAMSTISHGALRAFQNWMKFVYYIGNWWWVEHTLIIDTFCKLKSFSIVVWGFKIILWCNSDDELLLRNIYCETGTWNLFIWKIWNWEWGLEWREVGKMRVEMQRKCFKWLQLV